MAVTFEATPKHVAANSYVLVATADDYFARRQHSDSFSALTVNADKERVLMAATERLEQSLFRGSKTTSAQRLKWPRYDVSDDDDWPYDHNVVPRPVQDATCELALHLLSAGTSDPLVETGTENLEGLATSGLRLDFRMDAAAPGALPVQVQRLLRGLLVNTSGSTRLVRA